MTADDGMLFGWYFNGDSASRVFTSFRLSAEPRRLRRDRGAHRRYRGGQEYLRRLRQLRLESPTCATESRSEEARAGTGHTPPARHHGHGPSRPGPPGPIAAFRAG